MRPGPGTWGSLAALLIWLAVRQWAHPTSGALAIGTVIAACVALLVGIPASSIVAREAGANDPGFVVLDEVVGQWIALIAAGTIPWLWLLAFVLFRGFDILKPSPARELDRIPGGFGIMMDDVAAGIYALIGVWIVHYFLVGGKL